MNEVNLVFYGQEGSIFEIHPLTQETTALAVEECVTLATIVTSTDMLCFGGFRQPADDPPKPWRRWVCLLGTTGLPMGLHFPLVRKTASWCDG
jgi:hypothetical protein